MRVVGRTTLAIATFGSVISTPMSAASADTAQEIKAIRAQMASQQKLLKELEAKVAKQKEDKAKHASEHGAAPTSGSSASTAVASAPKHWYERINIRGYTQMRYNAILNGGPEYNDISSPADRSVGPRQNFLLRRVRLIFSGDISDHLYLYLQPDFASAPSGSFSNSVTASVPSWIAPTRPWGLYNEYGFYANNPGNFAQLRDAYADIYIDDKKEFRVRAGQSKIPYGFENMQSSQNRLALDRADAINSCCKDERDLGLFFYYTPENIRHVFRDLVKNNLKGSGDYGVVGVGVYNGQGANRFELNKGTHVVGRVTYPYTLENGQIIEASVQGYTGRFMPYTNPISPALWAATNLAGYQPTWLGRLASSAPFVDGPGYYNMGNYRLNIYNYPGLAATSTWTTSAYNGGNGIIDQRVAVTGVIYPQPFGLKAEWNWGRGPSLNDTQTAVTARGLNGGYVEATYKYDDKDFGTGTWFPFVKWQYYRGGAKPEINSPYNRVNEWDFGVEWQPIPEVELTAVYSNMDRTNVLAAPYRQFQANLMRMQLQWNY